MKKSILLSVITLFASAAAFAVTYSVKSPDGKLEAKINAQEKISFSLLSDSKVLLKDVEIAMNTDKGAFGVGAKVESVKNISRDGVIKPVYGINSEIKDKFNQLELDFKTFKIQFRAYDEAVAYRFVSNLGKGEMKVLSETLNLNIPQDTKLITALDNDMSCYEEPFSRVKVSDLKKPEHSERSNAILPTLIPFGEKTVAIVESDVEAYPMLRFVYDEKSGLASRFVNYPKSMKPINNFMVGFDTFENFIAKTSATRAFPWRAFIVADNDADLSVNDTVFKLAPECRIKDTSWISYGACAWEWWSDWNLEGVDFKTGVNAETYRYYIDFAAKNNIPFVLFDAGWLVGRDVGGMPKDVHERMVDGKPFLDVASLIKYAHSKDVKVVLWCLGHSLDLYTEKAIKLMKSWGADGFKVDFFNRDDQTAMELYYKIARIAAENKMLVDFHGCAKPAGINRAYPNVINFEAVLGLEQVKFSKKNHTTTPSHDVDLVMTRMLQGPMDYTPGAMTSIQLRSYAPNFSNPATPTTRAHQVALYTLFYAPLQMLCDSATAYEKYPEITSFMASTPTTWDESKAICAKIGKYVVLARRSGDVWYVAGICDEKGKDFEVDLSKILPAGETYTAEIVEDSINSNTLPSDYKMSVRSVDSSDKLKMSMKQGGGFAIRLSPSKFPIFSDIIRALF